ncbi:AbfB domain-containing protein [Streptomyces rimosus]|uniref:AbfB domain-containing protein n=1 Tax=Streptomyces rimosus TaxID=1927 RepID=UPI00131E3DCC|nr:AbfB domain-containing protein [Streptomyces rimosus]
MTATALVAVTGIAAPAGAFAAPSGAAGAVADVSRTGVEQRVDAASILEFELTPEQYAMSDRDFILVLWRKAKDAGGRWDAIRVAAEEAFASTSADDHVRFITDGIRKASVIDAKRQQEEAAEDRNTRTLKSQALIAVGIPTSPELLGLSDENFIRAIMKHEATTPEVRKAASQALGEKDPAAWREFITNGVREAHDRDTANERKELEQKDREKAQRQLELDARRNAGSLFGIVPSEAMLILGDDNFIRELINRTPAEAQDTELFAAAQKALNSSDAADWRTFIHSGANQAYKRDAEIKAKKKADSDRRKALAIQAQAAKTGVRPNLVAAAEKALRGTPEDVSVFLREGQYRALRQSLQAPKMSGWFIRQSSVDGGSTFLAPVGAKGKESDREDATWIVQDALAAEPGCFSFESVRKPGFYLTLKDSRVRIAPSDDSPEFRKDATWCAHKGLAGDGTSFTSKSNKDSYLRQYKGDLYAAVKGGKRGFETAKDFEQDVTWKLSTPLAG